MEITYKHLSSEERTLDVSDEDVEKLRSYAIACIVDRMRVISLKSPYCRYEYLLAELCEKYGADIGSKLEVTNFLSACLKPEASLLKPNPGG